MYQKHLQSGIATFTVSNTEQQERNNYEGRWAMSGERERGEE